MSLRLILEPEAVAEAQELYQWYEEQESGIGDYFFDDLGRCFEAILEDPERPRSFSRGVRKWKLRNFPVFAFYRLPADSVRILSVFHGARHPSRWQRRA